MALEVLKKETYIFTKEPDLFAKEPCASVKEPCISAKEPKYSEKRSIYPQKSPMYPQNNLVYLRKILEHPQKSPIYPQKSPIYPHKSLVHSKKNHMYPQKSLYFAFLLQKQKKSDFKIELVQAKSCLHTQRFVNVYYINGKRIFLFDLVLAAKMNRILQKLFFFRWWCIKFRGFSGGGVKTFFFQRLNFIHHHLKKNKFL